MHIQGREIEMKIDRDSNKVKIQLQNKTGVNFKLKRLGSRIRKD